MAAPTGEQFEITSDNGRAVITEIGAGLRAFEWHGVPYLETFIGCRQAAARVG